MDAEDPRRLRSAQWRAGRAGAFAAWNSCARAIVAGGFSRIASGRAFDEPDAWGHSRSPTSHRHGRAHLCQRDRDDEDEVPGARCSNGTARGSRLDQRTKLSKASDERSTSTCNRGRDRRRRPHPGHAGH